MNSEFYLNDEAKQLATNLATNIYECKQLCPDTCETLWVNKGVTNAIMNYWRQCNNEKTNYALNKLLAFMSRKHLENCFNGNSTTHPQQEN